MQITANEVTVISHIACTYLPKKAFEARLRDGRPKFRNAKTKQGNRRKVARDGVPKFRKAILALLISKIQAKQDRVFLGKVITRKKKKPKSYSGRLLTASGGRQ